MANVLSVSVVISNFDLVGLHATSKQIVAAPGADKVLLPLWATREFNYGTTTYSVSGNGNYGEFRYDGVGTIGDNTSIDRSNPILGGYVLDTIDIVESFQFFTFGNNVNGLSCVDKALILTQEAGSAYITGDGSATLTLWYVAVDV